jgi:O-6-methylguanine DNA methyltransferase
MKSFKEKVLDVVTAIKEGEVLTYKEVAKCAGNVGASRAVGTIMANNADKNVPCHRVVKSDGSVGIYNSLRGKSKSEILKKEGVEFKENGKVVFE